MMKKEMETAINRQINAEMYSSYLYLSMNAYFESAGLKGFANWMQAQAQEELFHAMKLYGFVNDRGGRVTLTAIDGPPVTWESPLEVFRNVLAHEEKVTGLINDLVDLAISLKDHATNSFLRWFVDEQVEEEANANDIVQELALMGDSAQTLYLIDKELATRVFTPPATPADT